MRKNRLIRFAAAGLAVILTFGAAGCGKASSTASSTTEAAKAETTKAAGGKTVIATVIPSEDKPLSYIDDDGNLAGYEYDIIVAVNELLENYELDITATTEETIDLKMESGDAIVSTGGYYWNETRAEKYLIPETPIGASSLSIYIRGEDADTIKSIADVAAGGYKLAPVSPNGGAYNALASWNEENDNGLGDIPTAEGIGTAEKIQDLVDGKYDAVVVPNNYGVNDIIEELGVDVVESETPIFTKETIVLVNKEYEELADEINTALATLYEDGTLAELSVKWYGANLFELLEE